MCRNYSENIFVNVFAAAGNKILSDILCSTLLFERNLGNYLRTFRKHRDVF